MHLQVQLVGDEELDKELAPYLCTTSFISGTKEQETYHPRGGGCWTTHQPKISETPSPSRVGQPLGTPLMR